MCKHCTRLTEDIEYKGLIHDFMQIVSSRLSHKVGRYINPDDVKIMFAVDSNEKLDIAHGFEGLNETPGIKKIH